MAKEIDLTGLRKPDGAMSTPPPASAPQRNGPPLGVGEVVKAIDPKELTAGERATLESVGWKEGEPVPDNMPEILAAQAEAKASVGGPLPPPVDPSTPPVKLQVQDISELPADKQDEVRQKMAEALGQAEAVKQDEQQAARAAAMPDVARKMVSAAMNPKDTGPAEQVDRPATRTVPDADYTPDQGSVERAEQIEEQLPKPQAGPAYCPHCNWDMSRKDIEPPGEADRASFLQALLGMKPYTKKVPLMGGAFSVSFRTLTTAESDAAFSQAMADRDAHEFISELDFWEKVNRYRMYLQIFEIDREGRQKIELPDGLDKETNPNSAAHWKLPEGVAPLKAIEQYVLTNVLPNESVARIVQVELNRFNQQVSKMEAMVDDTDFWKATGQQSSSSKPTSGA